MDLKPVHFFVALIIALGLLIPYELYWKYVEGWPPYHDLQSYDYWADSREKVDDLETEDVLILGSSRGHFDINIYLWDSISGRRPIMLAFPGSSPYHPMSDIVNNTNFKGLLVVSTAPGLFYTTTDSRGAGKGKKIIDHYYKRTYAQRFNHFIYQYIDPQFSYVNEELRLVNLVERLPFKDRDSVKHPLLWPPMVQMDANRNIRMLAGMEEDTATQNQQKKIWTPKEWKNRVQDSVDVIMDHYVGLVKKHVAKGGKVVFIRPPVSGIYLQYEPQLFPRASYWERLLKESEAKGYHFLDYEETKDMDPPEWSHLNREDSDIYTKWLVKQLQKDKLL